MDFYPFFTNMESSSIVEALVGSISSSSIVYQLASTDVPPSISESKSRTAGNATSSKECKGSDNGKKSSFLRCNTIYRQYILSSLSSALSARSVGLQEHHPNPLKRNN